MTEAVKEGAVNTSQTPAAKEERKDVLLRQVKIRVQQDGQSQDTKAGVPFGKLISLASGAEKCQLITGWIAAGVAGAVLPGFFLLLGDIFNQFGADPEETLEAVQNIFFIMLGLGVIVYICGFIQFSQLMSASASISQKIKAAYLEAVLRQESAWFDLINYTELSSRISKECTTI